ncbi:hypothetical protein EJB05_01843, partial [Eragrostis curvula]
MDIAQARVKLVLLWTAAIGVVLWLYVVVGFVWGSAAMFWFAWRFLCSVLPEAEAETGQAHGGGLSLQDDVDDGAIPAFEYHRRKEAASEQCVVCISAVWDGETVRRMPACGHAFHAPCIDGWLRNRATCPVCRAEVAVAGVRGGVVASTSKQHGLRSQNAYSLL